MTWVATLGGFVLSFFLWQVLLDIHRSRKALERIADAVEHNAARDIQTVNVVGHSG